MGGPIALLQNGDPIVIDASANKRTIDVLVDEKEMARRKVGRHKTARHTDTLSWMLMAHKLPAMSTALYLSTRDRIT